MAVAESDLWQLTRAAPQIDPERLATAVEREVAKQDLDFRTRLLIRDSVDALERHWGPQRLKAWLSRSPASTRIEAIRREDLGTAGFPSLAARVMETTAPEQILQYLRELGSRVHRPTRLRVGGSAALILADRLDRHTEDIDVVDEVPDTIRNEHDLLDSLLKRHGLYLAHFQSHYLPQGWDQRVRSLGSFGQLDVELVDPYDIALSKLFSRREKDRDDLRVLSRQLDKEELTARLQAHGLALLGEPDLRDAAVMNWYVVYGEPLPA